MKANEFSLIPKRAWDVVMELQLHLDMLLKEGTEGVLDLTEKTSRIHGITRRYFKEVSQRIEVLSAEEEALSAAERSRLIGMNVFVSMYLSGYGTTYRVPHQWVAEYLKEPKAE